MAGIAATARRARREGVRVLLAVTAIGYLQGFRAVMASGVFEHLRRPLRFSEPIAGGAACRERYCGAAGGYRCGELHRRRGAKPSLRLLCGASSPTSHPDEGARRRTGQGHHPADIETPALLAADRRARRCRSSLHQPQGALSAALRDLLLNFSFPACRKPFAAQQRIVDEGGTAAERCQLHGYAAPLVQAAQTVRHP